MRPGMRRRRAAAFLVPVLLSSACGGDGPPGDLPAPVVRDSAGVRVVENRLPQGPLPAWATVAPDPDWTLAPGPAGSGAPRVEIRGAATLADGRVAVADAGSHRVRYFRDDREVWSMGGRGEGPGRFLGIAGMGRTRGDTVWVSDPRSHEVTLVDPAGEESLEGALPVDGTVVGRFGDGRFLATRVRASGGPPPGALRRDTADYLVWSPITGDTTLLGRFPASQLLTLPTEEGDPVTLPPPLARGTSLAVGPGRVYVGDQEGFEIRGYDPDGTLRQVVRLEGVDRSVSEALLSTLTVVGPTGEVPPWADRFWEHTPETLPAFGRILLDARGNLWVAEATVADRAPRGWTVFAPDGTLRGGVEVPEGLTVLEVGSTHLLGLADRPGRTPELRRHRLRVPGV